ncbi:MAG TPA: hypothetical protein VHN13_23220, partial [Candidatus Tectomicrobia bacterium]|nr:hypothetical protein [Candidatus Tectomicrobia bacterium]
RHVAPEAHVRCLREMGVDGFAHFTGVDGEFARKIQPPIGFDRDFPVLPNQAMGRREFANGSMPTSPFSSSRTR